MNFWRKTTGQKGKQKQTESESAIICNGNNENQRFSTSESPEKRFPTSLQRLFLSELSKTDTFASPTLEHCQSSRLSKTLSEVLNDKGALSYFIQYLENRGALSYLKFWLDVESFRSAFRSSNISSPVYVTGEELESPRTVPSISHDSLSVSTDCDSLTADSNSLFEYSACNNTTNEPARTLEANVEPNGTSNSQTSANFCDNTPSDKLVLNRKCSNGISSLDQKLYHGIVDDARRIYKRYISIDAPNTIRCPEDIRQKINENLCECLTVDCFDKAQQFVFKILENDFYNDFLRSDLHCKHQIDVLTSGNVTLSDILYNETALFYFMEYLEQEQCRNILEFWIAVTNFRHNLKTNFDLNKEQIQGDAIVLYDKYFSLQATNPLGFPDSIRFEIEQNICDENGPSISCFDKPMKLVEIVLESNFLKGFLSSQLFFKYLSELISTIQTSACSVSSTSGRHRRIGSDSSSEISSISAHNTLLAMEDKVSTKSRKRRNGETDMSIDTRHIYDPDSLWRRKQMGGLSLGRVTELGRFETAIEPEPDKRNESKIGMVMKKLVNMHEDKTKEEMAWQIAEMIVKDITSLTLNESPPF